MITRRKLLIALGAGGLTAPLACFAQQQPKVWRIGFLHPRSRPASPESDPFYGLFPQDMRELGYVEGKNVVIEWRFADTKFDRLPGLAAELVQLKVDVIVTVGPPATRAAKQATSTIPIVMVAVGDPVGAGLVASLARPGGNITGLSNVSVDVSAKLVELLLAAVPKLARVAILQNPANELNATVLKNIRTATQQARLTPLPYEAHTASELEAAFAAMARDRARAVIVVQDAFYLQERRQLAELAARYRLPSVYTFRGYADSGGLMSYGVNLADQFRRAAVYVDKILKGAKPADLPVEQPTTFELVVNMKTAKALGIKIPNSILVRADKVIE